MISVIIGILCIIISIYILKKELKSAIHISSKSGNLELNVREELDELNSSFFDIANDLEGKFSIHEKQISDIETKLDILIHKLDRLEKHRLKYMAENPKSNSNIIENKSNKAYNDKVADKTKVYTKQDKSKQIYSKSKELLNKGVPITEVAKELNIGVNELKLIIDFYKNIV